MADKKSSRVKVPLVICALGLVGVLSLLFAPLAEMLPAGVDVPPAALLINPAVLVVVATFVGWFAARRVGLQAPLIESLVGGAAAIPSIRGIVLSGAVAGLTAGAALAAYAAVTVDVFADQSQVVTQPLITRLLYGGITEEVLARWGLLSLFAWVLLRLGLRKSAALAGANVLAAGLFAAGHLPVLFLFLGTPPLWLLVLVLTLNTAVGIVFGWLYIRKGLEAAMIGHAATHLVAATLAVLL